MDRHGVARVARLLAGRARDRGPAGGCRVGGAAARCNCTLQARCAGRAAAAPCTARRRRAREACGALHAGLCPRERARARMSLSNAILALLRNLEWVIL